MWVADHPAHLHLVASLRERGSSDLLIAVRRPEVDRMIDASESRLEGLDLLGSRGHRSRRVRVAIALSIRGTHSTELAWGRPFRRMVAKQAPIELIAARRMASRPVPPPRYRIDRASMALGRWSQPTVIVPESWGASRVGLGQR